MKVSIFFGGRLNHGCLAQLFHFALQCLDAFPLSTWYAIADAAVDLVLLHPFMQCDSSTPNLGRNRFNRRPLRGVILPGLLHQAYRTLSDFR